METESIMVIDYQGLEVWGDAGQRVKAFSYEINKLWGFNVQPGDYNAAVYIWNLLRQQVLIILTPYTNKVTMGGDRCGN